MRYFEPIKFSTIEKCSHKLLEIQPIAVDKESILLLRGINDIPKFRGIEECHSCIAQFFGQDEVAKISALSFNEKIITANF